MIVIIRSLVIILGGVTLGLAWAEAFASYRAWRQVSDRRAWGIVLIRIGIGVAVVFVETVLLLRLGDTHLTWRTVLAALMFTLWTSGMLLVLRDDQTRRRGKAWLER